jgi:hypothetical protein
MGSGGRMIEGVPSRVGREPTARSLDGRGPMPASQGPRFRILDKRSCIYYADIKEASVVALEQLQAVGKLQNRTPVSSQLLARIREGVSLSRDIEVK